MIKLGADSVEMREMSNDDIFSSRLKLLIIMIKAYLKDCPLGNYRKQAIIENANQVFCHSLQLVSESSSLKDHGIDVQTDIVSRETISAEHMFHQRVQLLSVMAKAIAENRSMSSFRKKSITDNLNKICETLIFNFQVHDVDFLKVA
jgi:hypothetical protein